MKALRIHDRVVLMVPRPILDIGYEINIDNLSEQVRSDSQVTSFIYGQNLDRRASERVIRAVASSRLAKYKKRGNKRRILWGEEIDDLRGGIFTITDRRVRKTGTYDPGHAFYGTNTFFSWGDEYEMPALNVDMTYVCYCLSVPYKFEQTESEDWDGFWVTSQQVTTCSCCKTGESGG